MDHVDRISVAVCWLALALGPGLGRVAAQQHEPIQPPAASQAFIPYVRALATNGHRAEALDLLQKHLQESPNDVDARLLYGIFLSWKGRYDEARHQLRSVLASHPGYSDARMALLNVELWSDHPDAAKHVIREGLTLNPYDPELLLALARAQRAEKQQDQAVVTLDRVLQVDPANERALQMRRSIREDSYIWEATFNHSVDWFSDSTAPQQESYLSLRRGMRAGSVIARLSRADRFHATSNQGEVDFYPSIRPGTYGYLNLGYSDGVLYPRYRVGADLFHNFPAGFEGSGGFRRLRFSSNVNIYTGSVGKYYGNWFFNVRPFFTPDLAGTSHSVIVSARRYFGNSGFYDYIGFRVGHGASLEARTLLEIEVLKSSSFYTEFNKSHGHWAGQLRMGISREDRLNQPQVLRYVGDGNIYFRF